MRKPGRETDICAATVYEMIEKIHINFEKSKYTDI